LAARASDEINFENSGPPFDRLDVAAPEAHVKICCSTHYADEHLSHQDEMSASIAGE
jgi:hypothetical protein